MIAVACDLAKLREIGCDLLHAIGEDPEREGLAGTPDRFARWWAEFIDYEAGNHETTFEAITTDQMVVVSGIEVWSLCEHHLLPFSARVAMGYIARDRVLGLSKFARIAHKVAHRLQIQERLVDDIAGEIERVTGAEHVAVVAQGQHLCMAMRGIRTEATMTTSSMRGSFLANGDARAEFLRLAGV